MTVAMKTGSSNKQPPNLSRAVQRRCVSHSGFVLFMLYIVPRFLEAAFSRVLPLWLQGERGHEELCMAPKVSAKM